MEQSGKPEHIHLHSSIADQVQHQFKLEAGEAVNYHLFGSMQTYFISITKETALENIQLDEKMINYELQQQVTDPNASSPVVAVTTPISDTPTTALEHASQHRPTRTVKRNSDFKKSYFTASKSSINFTHCYETILVQLSNCFLPNLLKLNFQGIIEFTAFVSTRYMTSTRMILLIMLMYCMVLVGIITLFNVSSVVNWHAPIVSSLSNVGAQLILTLVALVTSSKAKYLPIMLIVTLSSCTLHIANLIGILLDKVISQTCAFPYVLCICLCIVS